MQKLGPGFLIAAAFIGPGTVTTATLAGANFGYSLVWALLFSVFATFVLQEMALRLGVVSKLGLAEALRKQIQQPVFRALAVALVVVAIGIGNAAYEAGNLTGAAIGMNNLLGGDVALWAGTLGIVASAMLLLGGLNLLKWVLTSMVLLMSTVFVVTMLASDIDLWALLRGGFRFSIPDGGLTTTLAIIGTTVVPYNLFLHASLAKEYSNSSDKKQTLKQLRKDALIAIAVGGIITLSVMVTAAVAFFGQPGSPDMGNIADQLRPILGDWAPLFFALGLFAAGLTSAITAPLAAGFAVCGAMGWSTDFRAKPFRLVALTVLLAGTLLCFLQIKPLTLILLAQAANGLLLPILAVFLWWMVNQTSLMAGFGNRPWQNMAAAIVVLAIAVLSLYKLAQLI